VSYEDTCPVKLLESNGIPDILSENASIALAGLRNKNSPYTARRDIRDSVKAGRLGRLPPNPPTFEIPPTIGAEIV
jgi:hypothetical protein